MNVEAGLQCNTRGAVPLTKYLHFVVENMASGQGSTATGWKSREIFDFSHHLSSLYQTK